MLDGLLGSMPLWAHLREVALSDSLLLVLLCPRGGLGPPRQGVYT